MPNSPAILQRISYYLLYIISLLLLLSYFSDLKGLTESSLRTDFGKFYESANFFWQKKSLYTTITFVDYDKYEKKVKRKILPSNLNPPVFNLLLLPLGLLTYEQAFLIWMIISLVFGFISLRCVYLELMKETKQNDVAWPALITCFLAYFPTFMCIRYGQTALLLLLPTVFAWLALRRDKLRQMGVWLGLLMAMKPFYGLFILWFIVRRKWLGLSSMLAVFAVANLLAWAVLGQINYLDYYRIMHNISWFTSSWNASIYGMLGRIFGLRETNIPTMHLNELTSWIYYGLVILIIACVTWLIWPRKQLEYKTQQDIGFAVIIIAMLLISPFGWLYYFPLLLVPGIILWKYSEQSILIQLGLFVAALLTNIPHSLLPPAEITNNIIVFTWGGFYCYGLMLFLSLFCVWQWQKLYGADLSTSAAVNTVMISQLSKALCLAVFLPSSLTIFMFAGMAAVYQQ